MKTVNPTKPCVRKILRTRKIFYVHEIAAVDLSNIYFLKNAKKGYKPNNHDLIRDWKSKSICSGKFLVFPVQVTGCMFTTKLFLKLCLKDMYIILKGIAKIQFISILKILIIFKFLNFTAFFTKKIDLNFPKFAFNCPCEKVNFTLREKCPNTEFFLVRIFPYLDASHAVSA